MECNQSPSRYCKTAYAPRTSIATTSKSFPETKRTFCFCCKDSRALILSRQRKAFSYAISCEYRAIACRSLASSGATLPFKMSRVLSNACEYSSASHFATQGARHNLIPNFKHGRLRLAKVESLQSRSWHSFWTNRLARLAVEAFGYGPKCSPRPFRLRTKLRRGHWCDVSRRINKNVLSSFSNTFIGG